MNPPSVLRRNDPQEPQHEKDDEDSPEHGPSLLLASGVGPHSLGDDLYLPGRAGLKLGMAPGGWP